MPSWHVNCVFDGCETATNSSSKPHTNTDTVLHSVKWWNLKYIQYIIFMLAICICNHAYIKRIHIDTCHVIVDTHMRVNMSYYIYVYININIMQYNKDIHMSISTQNYSEQSIYRVYINITIVLPMPKAILIVIIMVRASSWRVDVTVPTYWFIKTL